MSRCGTFISLALNLLACRPVRSVRRRVRRHHGSSGRTYAWESSGHSTGHDVAAQTADWNATQFAFYQVKVAQADAQRKALANRGGVLPYGCTPPPCIPASRTLFLPLYQESGGYYGCTCGPVAVEIALAAYGQYPTVAAIAVAMGVDTNGQTSKGSTRGQVKTGLNHFQSTDPYIWSGISYNSSQGPVDLMADTSVDIGGYGFPLGYNVLTYSPWWMAMPPRTTYPIQGGHGAPMVPRWPQSLGSVYHYISGVGYSETAGTITVNDPAWGSRDAYTTYNVWAAIDNMDYPTWTDQVVW